MSKGDATRERIVERAFLLAGRDGVNGLTIGALAGDLGLSKSGLFAHFGSKEDLQLAVLERAADRFTQQVVLPAFKAPRGLPRIRALFENWIKWGTDARTPGGCLLYQATGELDDLPGRPRDYLADAQLRLQQTLERAARLAVEEGHFAKKTDCAQFAFEAHGLAFALFLSYRLLKDPRAIKKVRAGFERLIASSLA